MEILNVSNLTKTYGKGNTTVTALGGVSFTVQKGEFIAIVGASGSGKSTLMHMLGGVDRPTAGSVLVDGQPIFDKNESELAIFRRRNIGLIYQFYNLIPTLTAEENIMLPRLLDKRKPAPDKLQQILDITGLANRKNHLPSQLSGGQQQRVSIGRALINDPAIILADEPTGNLDSRSGEEIMAIFQRLNHEGVTIVMVTHEPEIAMHTNRLVAFKDGQIIKDEPVSNPTQLV